MASTYWRDIDVVECPFAGSLAIPLNCLMWSDTLGALSQGKAYPATSQTDQGSEATNQAYFGPKFLGVAREVRAAAQTQTKIAISRVYVGPMAIDSGTYYQGDLVAAVELANGTQLSNAKVKKTTTAADAIGFVLMDSGGAVTTVTVCLISRVLPTYTLPLQVINTAGFTMDDGANIALNTTTGTKLGTAVGQKLGFWNATPIVQPAAAGQGAVTATVGSAVATNSATNSTPFGYVSDTQADAIVTNVNALRVDVLALNTLVGALRTALVNAGIAKGGA
jgi:hypothetical protein